MGDLLRTSCRHSTQWLFPLYTSEISIVLALPVLHVLQEDAPESPQDASFVPEGTSRHTLFWELLWDRTKRKYALQKDPKARIYQFKTIMVCMTWIRICLLWSWMFLVLMSMDTVNGNVDTLVPDMEHVLFYERLSGIGWYCFLASLGVHWLMYSEHRSHLVYAMQAPNTYDNNSQVPLLWFFIAKCSLLNFILNITSWGVQAVRPSQLLVLLCNSTAGSIMAFALRIEHPSEMCWGCYRKGTSLRDLNKGPCPAFFSNPEQAYSAVCTDPGARCGFEELRWKLILHHYITITEMIIAVSFAIYITSFYNETKYYVFEHQRAKLLSQKKK